MSSPDPGDPGPSGRIHAVPEEARVGLDKTRGHGPKTAWCRDSVAAAGVTDGFLPKLEELLVERSKGKIRANVAHAKIMGYSRSSGRPGGRSPG
jgi:hypothetical protein